MTEPAFNIDDETKSLIVAITDFLRDQLITRTDLIPEDKDCLEIAIQSLEMAYGLEGSRYLQYRFSRPLMDIFSQVTNPVSVRDKIRADAHKDAGNNYMRRRMFENAETEYNLAIELDKWNSIYYCNRASSRIEQSNFFEAIADCRQALMLNPDYAKAHSRMGQAYALLHRPREAARCFRQALELEPGNERYRHNLRVAENQVDTPDVAQVITNLIGTLFGLGPQTTEDRSLRRLPPSFMIITESHPPIPDTSQNIETDENTDRSQLNPATKNNENENKPYCITSGTDISFPQPFGVLEEGSEEQPILELQPPTQTEDRENGADEFVLNIPLISFEFIPPTRPLPSQVENTVGNAAVADESSTKKIKEKEEESLPEHETGEKQNGGESSNISQNHDSSSIAEKQSNNQEVKKETQTPINENKTVSSKNDVNEEDKISSSDLSNEHQCEIISNLNNSKNVLSSTEKSQENSERVSPKIENQSKISDDSQDEKHRNDFIFGSGKKHVVKNTVNPATSQNEETDGGETSEKHTSFEEDVD